MPKKTLFCAVSVSTLALVPVWANGAQAYESGFYRTHPYRVHSAWHGAHPAVVRGYYPNGYAPLRHAAWSFGYPGAAYGVPVNAGYVPTATPEYPAQIVAYRSATAFVPVTTYAPVPIRVYYIPQQQPYYNVPPYAVRELCNCN
jgi:hypothetical protein